MDVFVRLFSLILTLYFLKEGGMADQVTGSVDIHYLKANDFRVVHADGVWGGVAPRGYITMSVFSERSPIPRKMVFDVTPDGQLGPETSRDSKEGIVREVEVEVVMDVPLAKSLIEWLKDKIEFFEKNYPQNR